MNIIFNVQRQHRQLYFLYYHLNNFILIICGIEDGLNSSM